MPSTILINPRYERFVRQHRLHEFDRVMHWHGATKVGRQTGRHIDQFEVEEDGRKVRLFVKREWRTYLKDRLRNWVNGLGWSTKARREWHVLVAMNEAGLGCAEPVVMAERSGFCPQGYLVLREIRDAVLLSPYLAEHGAMMTVEQRRQLAAHLGREVARLHRSGIDHPDLFSKHILLIPTGGPGQLPQVSFIDMQRSTTRRFVPTSRRAHDLASLDATLPPSIASDADRLTFLQSYLTYGPPSLDARHLAASVRRRSRKLRERRKIRELLRIGRHAALALSDSAKAL